MPTPPSQNLISPDPSSLAMLQTPAAITRAVLMVSPLFEERKSTLYLLSSLSRQLSQDNTLVARLDLPGTGHTPGNLEDLTPASWQTSFLVTIRTLRDLAPHAPLYLLGVRISATFVTQLANTLPDIAGIILIAPVNGLRFLRQLAQRNAVNQMITHGRTLLPPGKIEEAINTGRALDFDGYAISPQLYRALESQTLQPCPCPTLLITTQHDAPDAQIPKSPNLQIFTLSLPAFWNTVGHIDPTPIITPVRDWLLSQPASEPRPSILNLFSHGSAPLHQPLAFSLSSTLGVVHGFRYIPHWPCAFAPSLLIPHSKILFLHGWSGDSTGPHRMFVKLARRLVASGHLCHMFDFGGRGESDGEHSAASIATMTDDARAAFQHMQAAAPDAPTIIIAICSGSKVALSLAAEGAPTHLVLLSAEPLGSLRDGRLVAWRKLCHAIKNYAVKLLQPQTWKKLLTGKVQASGVRSALVSAEKPSNAEIKRENLTLKKLRDFKGRILFLFAQRDPEAAPSAAAYSAFCRENKIPFDLHTLPNTGHSFYNLDAEAEVIERTTGFVEEIVKR